MAGEFAVQGVTVSELVEEYGSPLFVYDSAVLIKQYLGLRERLHPAMEIFFSLKSNPNMAICALLHSLGAGAEVSSAAELLAARTAGVEGRDILFPGPGKSADELAACLDAGVHAIICESAGELALIDRVARARGVVAPVALRVNPAFEARGSRLSMGGRPRQFGIDEAELLVSANLAQHLSGVRLVGVHVYAGTRILDHTVVAENTGRVFELADRVSATLGFPLDLVDVGGGLGVPYFDGETELDVVGLTQLLNPMIEDFVKSHPRTRVVMELGRYLTADSGTYVVQVRYLKTSRGQRFAIVDGGTHQHMAAVGIGSAVKRNFPIQLLNRPVDGPLDSWHVAGPLCTPNDTLGKNLPLPDLRPGDLLGVLRSGAYGPTASPVMFLGHGYPAEVLVHEGRPYLIRERDVVEDLLRGQRIPEFSR